MFGQLHYAINKRMKKVLVIVIMLFLMGGIVGCSAPQKGDYLYGNYSYLENEEYHEIDENDFTSTSIKQTSAFSLSASTASYANFRSMIVEGRTINPNAIRIEEMINYFSYDYPNPTGDDVLSMQASIIPTPWNEETHLLMIGMKAVPIERSETRNNLVFLLDVSGSMNGGNRLPLVQQSFTLLTEQLNDDDIVSIVTYAGSDKVLLDGGFGAEKTRIAAIISDLYASGSTAGSKGIQKAYELAAKHFIPGGNNRVILATDGDFNVGISSTSELEKFISKKRETGVYLSVLGFGYGNYKDAKLESLASKGNGNHAYIDTLLEARKALVEDINGTLHTVARDAKAQITFDSNTVSQYRLVGYENKMLSDEEFQNDTTDAGEIGAGHMVTAIYEIKLKDSLQTQIGSVLLRYKDPTVGKEEVLEQSLSISKSNINPSPNEDILFITSVLEVALILRESAHKGTASLSQAKSRIISLDCVENDVYKTEFLDLITKLIRKYD